MADLDSAIRVNISVADASIGRKGFGTVLIAGVHSRFGERVRTYSRLKELLADGFTAADPIYRAAARLLRASPAPSSFKVGRLAPVGPAAAAPVFTPVLVARQRYEVNVNDDSYSAQFFSFTPVVANSTTYSVTVNGVTYSIVSTGSATANLIVSALIAVINADTNRVVQASGTVTLDLTATNQPNVSVSATTNLGNSNAPTAAAIIAPLVVAMGSNAVVTPTGTTTLTLTSKTAGVPFGYEANPYTAWTVVDATPDAGIGVQLAAISEEDDNWYALAFLGSSKAEILAAATYIETVEKIMIAQTRENDVLTAVTTDVGNAMKTGAFNRSATMWVPDLGEYTNAGLLGVVLAKDAGSATFSYKTVPGSTATRFSTTVQTRLKKTNVIYYTTLNSRNVTMNGKMASGRWMDIQIGLDFLKARIQEEIFTLFVTQDKVPFNETGLESLAGAVRTALKAAETIGIVAANSWAVAVPTIAATTSQDRQDRILNAVDWYARLVGAVEEVNVNGNVTF